MHIIPISIKSIDCARATPDEDQDVSFIAKVLRYKPKPVKCEYDTGIKNVIFNDPATIVFWTDGTKTVVKTQNGEAFDPEKGLAMAIVKKALGNEGKYFNEIKKWVK